MTVAVPVPGPEGCSISVGTGRCHWLILAHLFWEPFGKCFRGGNLFAETANMAIHHPRIRFQGLGEWCLRHNVELQRHGHHRHWHECEFALASVPEGRRGSQLLVETGIETLEMCRKHLMHLYWQCLTHSFSFGEYSWLKEAFSFGIWISQVCYFWGLLVPRPTSSPSQSISGDAERGVGVLGTVSWQHFSTSCHGIIFWVSKHWMNCKIGRFRPAFLLSGLNQSETSHCLL